MVFKCRTILKRELDPQGESRTPFCSFGKCLFPLDSCNSSQRSFLNIYNENHVRELPHYRTDRYLSQYDMSETKTVNNWERITHLVNTSLQLEPLSQQLHPEKPCVQPVWYRGSQGSWGNGNLGEERSGHLCCHFPCTQRAEQLSCRASG